MIGTGCERQLAWQMEMAGLIQSSVCCLPRPTPAADHALERGTDKLQLEHRFAGSRMREGSLKNSSGKPAGDRKRA
jgi:hypothetical protein